MKNGWIFFLFIVPIINLFCI
ncbi:hypothetical protein CY0110_15757 [Crocosphaera chwakensis CCY0110]|uniref:Uncharacterized protein n=1 Tax=Crocosphaera chwakensis CCY0110 TaxID=391612 RepID=A3IHI3_9CHRO|nr:hypothetical protein CY0110_15757 [Crocosphaera chwakensis CCY0110]